MLVACCKLPVARPGKTGRRINLKKAADLFDCHFDRRDKSFVNLIKDFSVALLLRNDTHTHGKSTVKAIKQPATRDLRWRERR